MLLTWADLLALRKLLIYSARFYTMLLKIFRQLRIACWNGQAVRVAFALDTFDREVIAWSASTGGISG